MKKIINEFILTNELCVKYTRLHHFKIIRIILNLGAIGCFINAIVLTILNLKYNVQNTYGIILALTTMIIALATNFIYLTICGSINFNKTKILNPSLKNIFTFENENFTIINDVKNEKKSYSEIKKIFFYNDFIVIKMIDNIEYVLSCNGFDCTIDNFISFIGEELEKCEKE